MFGLAAARSPLVRPAPVHALVLVSLGLSTPTGCVECPSMSLDEVVPPVVLFGQSSALTLHGTGFHNTVRVTLEEEAPTIDRTWTAFVGDTSVEDVVRVSARTARLMSPPELPVGTYDVTLVSPRGDARTLLRAVRVVDAMGDAGLGDAGVSDADLDAAGDGGDELPCKLADLVHCFLLDGTLDDGVETTDLSGSVNFVPGIRDLAAGFTSTTGPVVLPGSAGDPFTPPVTMELTFRVDEVPATRAALIDQNGVFGAFAYPTSGSGELELRVTTTSRRVGIDRISLGEWHHLVMVSAPGALTVYLDGIAASDVGATTAPGNAGPLHLGSDSPDGSDRLVGALDALRVWGRALDEAESLQLFHP